jgi:hypothetical protein
MQIKGSGLWAPTIASSHRLPDPQAREGERAAEQPRVTAGSWLPFKLPSMAQLTGLAVFGLLRSAGVEAASSIGTDSLVAGTQPMGIQNFVGDWLDTGGRTVLVGSDFNYLQESSTSCSIFVQAITGARMWAPTVYAQGAKDEQGVHRMNECGSWEQNHELLNTVAVQKNFKLIDEEDPHARNLQSFACGPGEVAVGQVDLFFALGNRTETPSGPGFTLPWSDDVLRSRKQMPPLPGQIFELAQKCAPTLFLMGDQFWSVLDGDVADPEKAAAYWTGQNYSFCRLDLGQGIFATAIVPPVHGSQDFTDKLLRNCRTPHSTSSGPSSSRSPTAWLPVVAALSVVVGGIACMRGRAAGVTQNPPRPRAPAQRSGPAGSGRQRKTRSARERDHKATGAAADHSVPQRLPAGSARAVHAEACSVVPGTTLRGLKVLAACWSVEARESLGTNPAIASAMMYELISAWPGDAPREVLLDAIRALGVGFDEVVASLETHLEADPAHEDAATELKLLRNYELLIRSLEGGDGKHTRLQGASQTRDLALQPQRFNPIPIPQPVADPAPPRNVHARELHEVATLTRDLRRQGRAVYQRNADFYPGIDIPHFHVDEKNGFVTYKRKPNDHVYLYRHGNYQPAKMDGVRAHMHDHKGVMARFLDFMEGRVSADEILQDS